MNTAPTLALNKDEMNVFLGEIFPEMHTLSAAYEIISISTEKVVMKLNYHPSNLRPGGTISGPAIMTLCDIVMYVGVLSRIGRKALAVTTHFSIDFLNKPPADDIIAECFVIKQGKRLVVLRVDVYDSQRETLCAHAVGTYSIPS